jgi:hypothetical protein
MTVGFGLVTARLPSTDAQGRRITPVLPPDEQKEDPA